QDAGRRQAGQRGHGPTAAPSTAREHGSASIGNHLSSQGSAEDSVRQVFSPPTAFFGARATKWFPKPSGPAAPITGRLAQVGSARAKGYVAPQWPDHRRFVTRRD